MFITYLIILILSFVFKFQHWPGANLLLLFSCIFPLIDILIQSVSSKDGKNLRVLSSLGLTCIAVFFAFLFLEWPGPVKFFVSGIIASGFYFYTFFVTKARKDLRFFLMILITLFAVFNFSLKGSARKELYMAENPFSEDRVPSFILRDLAFDHYKEGDAVKAEFLLSKALKQLEKQKEYISKNQISGFEERIVSDNTEGINEDLEAVKNDSWDRKSDIIYEDFYTPE